MFPVVPAVTRPCFRPALQDLTISRSPAGMALPGLVRPGHVAIRAACSPFRLSVCGPAPVPVLRG